MVGIIRGVGACCAAAAVLAAVGVPPSATAGAAAAGVRPCSAGLVTLTFDDGPAAGVTPRLLQTLADLRVPATFFVVGARVDAQPQLTAALHDGGHQVGNHTYRHAQLTRLGRPEIRSELLRTRRAIRRAGAVAAPLMRPPYGAIDARVEAVAADLGMTPVLWDIDPRDWVPATTGTITRRVLGALDRRGSNVVLLHDGVATSGRTLAALPAIVRGARRQGYCFALLGPDGTPTPPVPVTRVLDAVVDEGPGRALRFRVRLDRPTSRAVSVRLRTVLGTVLGTAGTEDVVTVVRRVRFPRGTRRAVVEVPVLDDRLDEPLERLRVRLDRPRRLRVGDGTARGVVRDDDPPPRLRLSSPSVVEPQEGELAVEVQVWLSRPSGRRVAVTVATEPGSAGTGDYLPVRERVVFPAGARVRTVALSVLSDATDEDLETFVLRPSEPRHVRPGEAVATVTILPPPPPPGGEPPPDGDAG